MASLDKMEGEAVEAGMLLLLAVLLYFAYLAYKGVSGFKMPKIPTLSELLAALQAKLNDLLNGVQAHLPSTDPQNPLSSPSLALGPDTVYAGTDVGTYGQTDAGDLQGASPYGPYAGVNNG